MESNITLHQPGASLPTNSFPITYILPLLALYPALVAILRYRRANRYSLLYPPSTYATLTPQTAQSIVLSIGQLEIPLLFETCLQFALFKTYGIPTISGLLQQTSLLSEEKTCSKRYVDTDVLITEFVGNPWGGERWVEAIARMNGIHGAYGPRGGAKREDVKGKRILDDDMLYTLSLFALEPVKWMKMYEWREATELEKCAMGVFWKGLGDAMGIDYGVLPGGKAVENCEGKGKVRGWRDGLQWMDELEQWTEEYERKYMVPALSNHAVAEETVKLLLVSVPAFAKPLGKQAVIALLDERLREAMMYPPAPSWVVFVVHGLLYTRRFVIRHFMLPRPEIWKVRALSDEKNHFGKYFYKKYLGMPYYVQPSLGTRYGLKAWMRWALGLPVPGDQGKEFFPEGYRVEEVGPAVGKKGWEGEKIKVMDVGRRGCPIAFGG